MSDKYSYRCFVALQNGQYRKISASYVCESDVEPILMIKSRQELVYRNAARIPATAIAVITEASPFVESAALVVLVVDGKTDEVVLVAGRIAADVGVGVGVGVAVTRVEIGVVMIGAVTLGVLRLTLDVAVESVTSEVVSVTELSLVLETTAVVRSVAVVASVVRAETELQIYITISV